MTLREQLTEPWGIVAAGLLGGLGAAVTAALTPVGVSAIGVGVAVAGIVYTVKVAAGVVTDRRAGRPARRVDRSLPPAAGTAKLWLRRAEDALDTLRRQIAGISDAVLRGQVGDVDSAAEAAYADLERLGGQVTLVERAAANLDVAGLRRERDALADAAHRLPEGRLRAEKERAARAVADQLAVHGRLAETRATLLATMESTVYGLEGLVARVAELVAMRAASGGGSPTEVTRLTEELEGMRAGLAETEEISRRILAGEE